MQKIYKFILIISLIVFESVSLQAQSYVYFMEVAGIAGENVPNVNRHSVFTPTPSSQTVAVSTVTFGESATTTVLAATSHTAGNIREIQVSFPMDKATPLLFEKMWQRQLISSITIYIDKVGAFGQDEFQRIKLTNVFIKSMTFQSVEANAPILNMKITYEQILRGFAGRDNVGTLTDLGRHCYDYLNESNTTCSSIF